MRDYLSSYITGENPVQTPPQQLTKLTKPSSVSFVSPLSTRIQQKANVRGPVLTAPKAAPARVLKLVSKPKVWRREPYYPICVIATMENDQIQRQSADEFFAALALQDGHEPEYTAEILLKCSPAAGSTSYCQAVVAATARRQKEVLTPERMNLYVEHHPFGWSYNHERV